MDAFNFGSLCVVLRETNFIELEPTGQSHGSPVYYDLLMSFSKTSIETAEIMLIRDTSGCQETHIWVVPKVIQELSRYEHGILNEITVDEPLAHTSCVRAPRAIIVDQCWAKG